MRAINQRALLFTYKQENKTPDAKGDGVQYLEIFNTTVDEENVSGGIVADIEYGRVISVSMYPPKNRRILTPSGYVVRPMHDVETYRKQIKNNEGLNFLYLPGIRGGFPSGIYRINEWTDEHKMTTGGKNKVYTRAIFIDTDSFIVPVSDIQEEYLKRAAGSGLPVRAQNDC